MQIKLLASAEDLVDAGAILVTTNRVLENALRLHAIVAACLEIFEFLESAIRPMEHGPVDGVAPPQSEGHRQFRLRQVARSAAHHAGAGLAAVVDSDHRPNRVAIR